MEVHTMRIFLHASICLDNQRLQPEKSNAQLSTAGQRFFKFFYVGSNGWASILPAKEITRRDL